MRSGKTSGSMLRSVLLAVLTLALMASPGRTEEPLKELAAPPEELIWVEVVPDASAQPKFKTWLHPTPEKVAKACALRLSAAQWSQDILGFSHSAAHFDNCALSQGADFVQERLREADKAVVDKDFGAAMFALGQALHAVQDFYSHTNYVEKMAEIPGRSFAEVEIVPLWSSQGRAQFDALLTKGLTSGVVGYSDLKACPPGALDHNQIAKDTADFNDRARQVIPAWQNRSHYTAALDLAQQATDAFLVWAYQKWPGLAESCGRYLGYLAPGDRRAESPK
jgi:hypothetical protein